MFALYLRNLEIFTSTKSDMSWRIFLKLYTHRMNILTVNPTVKEKHGQDNVGSKQGVDLWEQCLSLLRAVLLSWHAT